MKKRLIIICLVLLIASLLLPTLSSCVSDPPEETESERASDEEGEKDSEVISSEESNPEDDETDETESRNDGESIVLEGKYASNILHANDLANGVQSYYTDPNRRGYRIENLNMSLDYSLDVTAKQLVTAIRNTKGAAYIENTMDVFVEMQDGGRFYASDSSKATRANLFKYGYYYYDLHLLEQNFSGKLDFDAEEEVRMAQFNTASPSVSDHKIDGDGVVSFTVSGDDPFITASRLSFKAEDYNAINLEICSTNATKAKLYFVAGSHSGHSTEQSVSFDIKSDGEYHNYTVIISDVVDYVGRVTSLRLDIDGAQIGETIKLKSVSLVKTSSNAPALLLDRNLHTYSDKMNQVLHFVATDTVTGIASLGIETRIAADTVDSLIVKDSEGLHTSLENVDWDSAEYVGFDIKGVGVFGIVLVTHENSGRLMVTLDAGEYIVTQSSTPENGSILPPEGNTSNDYYMGHRIYTDESHDLAGFIAEAEYERHPLEKISSDAYVGYDALRGAYRFTIDGSSFNPSFFTSQNKHYSCSLTLRGDSAERSIYIYTYFSGGSGEGAAILSDNEMILPIPAMIYKNFGSEDEEPIFNSGDDDYSETVVPIKLDANEKLTLTVINLYQNWGKYPLKQLSSIQYFAPYYHLSTGVTETSCIAPWYNDHGKNLWTLPDFRTMSGKWWFDYEGELFGDQPQHTHAGFHYFLQYTDADGRYFASENVSNVIGSSGLNYSEVLMDYISDDGRIKVSYNHLEFPQTDEHRAFYEINYEILEDISFKDFRNDFSFYTCAGYAGTYQKLGYLNESNEIAYANATEDALLILGDRCPYVSLYDLVGQWENKCGNIGFVIHSSDIEIGGEKYDGNFVLSVKNKRYSLSLDLGETTLKKGDKITLNMVIVPWGDESSTDDSNMQRIRENTCLKPLEATVSIGDKLESVFLPRIKSLDGKTAEFTLTGGMNNCAVRVYGFEKLTVPVIEEYVGGEWVEYDNSSVDDPDLFGNRHYYDGYFVFYDGDGTYSYTFIADMTDKESRTFRIRADEEFDHWPPIPTPENNDPINVLQDPAELSIAAINNHGFGDVVLADDGSYIRFYGNGRKEDVEGYFTAYSSESGNITGKYLAIKYRIPETNKETTFFQIFTNTVFLKPQGPDNFDIAGLVADGEWHMLIADLTLQDLPTFEADYNGDYIASFLRFDVFSSAMSTESYVDIAYVGLSSDLEALLSVEKELERADLIEYERKVGEIILATGEFEKILDPKSPESYIDRNSGYSASSLAYVSAVDYINGIGDGDGAYDLRGSRSTTGVDVFEYNGKTTSDHILAMAGWTVVYGGTEKYVWSADGGKTWNDCQLYGLETYAQYTEASGVVTVANKFFGVTNALDFTEISGYQGGETPKGISADLSAFVGSTVNVTFAAVPKNDTDSLCIITHIQNVTVE